MPALSPTEATISGLTTLLGLAVVAAHLVVGTALVFAARRLGRTRGAAWGHAMWPPIAALPLPLCGLGLTVVLLVRAFGALGGIDPAHRSSALAQGISEAMNATTLAAALAWSIYGLTGVALAIGYLTRRPR